MHPMGEHRGGGVAIEAKHRRDDRTLLPLAERVSLECRGQNPGAEPLGQHQSIPRAGTRVSDDPAGIDNAGHREAVFELGIIDGVATYHDRPRLGELLEPPTEDLCQDLEGEGAPREAGDREGGPWHPSHGVDVGEGVRRRDRSERVRVIDDRREEIDRAHDREVVAQAKHSRVVGSRASHEEIGVRHGREPRQDVGQVRRTQLCGSTGRFDFLGKANSLSRVFAAVRAFHRAAL